MQLTISNNRILEFVPGIPDEYEGPIINGSEAIWAKNNLAELFIQTLKGDGYTFRYIAGHFIKRIMGTGIIRTNGLYVILMLKNSLQNTETASKSESFSLPQNHYSICKNQPDTFDISFKTTNEFCLIDILFSQSMVEEMSEYFPDITNALKYKTTGNQPRWITSSLKEVYHTLFNTPYTQQRRQLYYKIKIRELLFLLLEHLSSPDTERSEFSKYEIERLFEAKDILNNSIDQKLLTIKELSRKVGINEYKLKKGFRKHFNSTIYDYQSNEKMFKAKELVHTTALPIKTIAANLGFNRVSNFITAFRKKFGVSPGELRR